MCLTGQPAAAMYSLISRLNHSCRANTAYHFKAGGAIVVRAVVDIEPGEELCISYLDPIQPLSRCCIMYPHTRSPEAVGNQLISSRKLRVDSCIHVRALMPGWRRRREEDLRQRFCFVCSCDRCASERQALRDEADMPSAAHCNRAGAEGMLLAYFSQLDLMTLVPVLAMLGVCFERRCAECCITMSSQRDDFLCGWRRRA